MTDELPAEIVQFAVNGTPVVGVPVRALIERDLEESIPPALWGMFVDDTEQVWRLGPDDRR